MHQIRLKDKMSLHSIKEPVKRLTKYAFVILSTFYSLLNISTTSAQTKSVVVSGYVKDAASGESLVGAVVSGGTANSSVASNAYGFFSLEIPAGRPATITVSFVGYQPRRISSSFKADTSVVVNLAALSNQMDEVVISANKNQKINSPVTLTPLTMAQVKQLPAFLGEADLIKTFQLKPGVSAVGDGASGFNVRGGGVDQNLVLLDEAPLYFTSHLFNLFSVANPDGVKDATLIKTEMPARYGGRLSSVMDIHMKDGNNQRFAVQGGLGLIASRLTVEGPLQKGKSSFIVSGRRSYTDLLTKLSSDPDVKDNSIYFYDLNAKLNITLSAKDRLYLSGYFGKDKIEAANRFLLQWGSGTGTLRWNHVYNPRLFSNLTVLYSNYRYKLGNIQNTASGFIWNAGIQDYIVKNDYSWFPDAKHNIHFGADVQLHEFSPGTAGPNSSFSEIREIKTPPERGAEYNVYWDHEWKVSPALSLEYGFRYNVFQSLAKDSTTVFDYVGEDGKRKLPVNPRTYRDWQSIKTFGNLQPRLSVRLQLEGESSVKASYTRTVQNLHLVSNTISTSPLDIWVPSSYNVRPQLADQFSLGYFRDFKGNKYSMSTEVFYRKLYNQIDYIDGAETLLNENLAGDMLFGKGRAYGAEFYASKNSGRFNGWISYTLSRTERQIHGLNNNEYFPTQYDKTHNATLVGIYQLRPRLSFSATFAFASGVPATLPDSEFEFQGIPVQNNSNTTRNNARIPSYNRLDLSLTLKNRQKAGRRFTSEWVFSAFNALNRRNAFSVYTRQGEHNSARLEAVKFSMFGSVVPSVTYNFKF